MKTTRRELFGLAAGGLAGLVVGCKVEPEPEPPPSPEEIEVEIGGPYMMAEQLSPGQVGQILEAVREDWAHNYWRKRLPSS